MVAPVPIESEELTGRVRLRVGFFRRIIPQVQVRVTSKQPMDPGPAKKLTRWRDATLSDLTKEFTCGDN